jgi:hypothetical protein
MNASSQDWLIECWPEVPVIVDLIFGWFYALRVCIHNETSEQGSRPMSASALDLYPEAGAGALRAEDLETALTRVRIYAEVRWKCKFADNGVWEQ